MEIIGNHTRADVKIDMIDQTTTSQIYSMVNDKVFSDYRMVIMPDCHAGSNCVIGFTSPLGKYVMPNIIGVDIGCGVLAFELDIASCDLVELDEIIKKIIPMGFSVYEERLLTRDPKINEMYDTILEVGGDLGFEPKTILRHICSLGTLGGGNHFIEMNRSVETSKLWLVVHSGSRKFGLDIANHFQKINDPQSEFGPNQFGILLSDGVEGNRYWKYMQIRETETEIQKMNNRFIDLKTQLRYKTRNPWLIMSLFIENYNGR